MKSNEEKLADMASAKRTMTTREEAIAEWAIALTNAIRLGNDWCGPMHSLKLVVAHEIGVDTANIATRL